MQLKHKECDGTVVYEYETIELKCIKCEKVWSIISDFSDIENRPQAQPIREKLRRTSIFSNIRTYHTPTRMPNWIYNFVSNDKLRLAAQMIDFTSEKNSVVLDVGCRDAYFSEYLAYNLDGIVIGADVSRSDLRRAKMRLRLQLCCEKSALRPRASVELICCDMYHLPLRKNSLNLVVCMSVIEHANDLDAVITEIRNTMKKDGIFIVGYPIEIGFFKAVLRLFLPRGSRIRDPGILGEEWFEKSPETHKQSFVTIRRVLQKYFLRMQIAKSFFTMLPDLVSWYECVKMMKKVK
jgi:SAM-dependent methyltransferase